VERGVDWKWGDQDGGSGNAGQITGFEYVTVTDICLYSSRSGSIVITSCIPKNLSFVFPQIFNFLTFS